MDEPAHHGIGRQKLHTLLQYLWPLATALTLLGSLEPLLHLSKLANILLTHWGQLLEAIWQPILRVFQITVVFELLEAVTLGLLFLISGVAGNPHLRKRLGLSASDFAMPWLLVAYVFNCVFFASYSVFRSLPALGSIKTDVEFYLLGLAIFAFILTILLSLQRILARNIILTIAYVLILVALDRLYDPLERFVL